MYKKDAKDLVVSNFCINTHTHTHTHTISPINKNEIFATRHNIVDSYIQCAKCFAHWIYCYTLLCQNFYNP